MTIFIAVAEIALTQTMYETQEGSSLLTVCTILISGILERNITALLDTSDQTAIGEHLLHLVQACLYNALTLV